MGYPIWTYTHNEHSSTKYNLWIMGIQCPFDNINTISQFQKIIVYHIQCVDWTNAKTCVHSIVKIQKPQTPPTLTIFLVFTHPSLGVPKDDWLRRVLRDDGPVKMITSNNPKLQRFREEKCLSKMWGVIKSCYPTGNLSQLENPHFGDW